MPPTHLPILAADAAAAAHRRGLPSTSFTRSQLIAIAQKVLGGIQDTTRADTVDALRMEHSFPLTVSGRIFDTAAGLLMNEDREAAYRLSTLSSIAFAATGNWPSARAAGSALVPDRTEDALLATALGSAIPSELGRILDRHRGDDNAGEYLRTLNAYLERGVVADADRLLPLYNACLAECSEPFCGAALRSARPVVAQLVKLSTARVLTEYEASLPAGLIQCLVNSGIKTLLPSQYSAIVEHGLLRERSNCLITYPTSTGKTLLGELCLAHGVGRDSGTAIYIAPYVALGRQTANALESHLPATCQVHRLFGTFAATRRSFGTETKDFIVCTPERFDGLLRGSPGLIDTLRVVVVDEAHMVESSTRGIRLEALLARLRMIQEQSGSPQIVVLSAVVADTSSLREWLGVDEHRVFKSDWRPSVGRIAIWTQDGSLEWKANTDVVDVDRSMYAVGQLTLPWPATGMRPTSHFGMTRKQEPKLAENVAYLCDFLFRQLRGPVLVVSATKRGTREIARALAERFPPLRNYLKRPRDADTSCL